MNCAILGGSLFMVRSDYTFGEAAVFGLGSGIGFALAIVALAAVREWLTYSNVPPPLRGQGGPLGHRLHVVLRDPALIRSNRSQEDLP